MGEHRTFRGARACSAAALLLAAAAALSGCSGLGRAAGAASAPSASQEVIDPSIPSATPSAEDVVPSASPTPIEKVTATPAPSDARTAVTPFITSATWDASAKRLDVSAIVPTVVEGDGTCSVTVTSGATTRTASAGSVAASSYTGCEAVSFEGLAAGTWQVRVRYSSDHAVGASASRAVTAG